MLSLLIFSDADIARATSPRRDIRRRAMLLARYATRRLYAMRVYARRYSNTIADLPYDMRTAAAYARLRFCFIFFLLMLDAHMSRLDMSPPRYDIRAADARPMRSSAYAARPRGA